MGANEKEIFRKMCRGDEGAFEYFFKKYYHRLYSYSLEILKDGLAAEEIVEELYTSIWEKRSQIELQSSPGAYLFKTAYNHCLNQIKHKKVEDKYYSYFKNQLAIADLEIANNSYPLSTLIEREFEASLEKSIEKLPDQCQQIFRMSRLEGRKNQEIAEKLKISVNTVKTQLQRALARVRKDLKHYFVVLFFRT
ncbi:RNA polymerase sigma-70 factor [Mangrovibacterium lignilyticum]|uniref:RNA polymerase sigma-70 factor n=1 Tax=Mangrovibacterium lignilyticum TaxID=2668052 RepID=UPI0013D26241|nr:RNA polymerase sigma-70 factor [Mangrovibacterium lignilyticum]